MSIIKSTSKPEFTMTKKSSTVCYHAVRESVVMGETLMTHIPGAENPAAVMMNSLSGSKHQYHVYNHMYSIFITTIPIQSASK